MTYTVERRKQWVEENRDAVNEYAREYYHRDIINKRIANNSNWRAASALRRKRNREAVLQAYGGKCSVCGLDDFRVLDLDHVKNDGNIERKKIGSTRLYQKLYKEGIYPKDRYQILCRNHNWIKYLESLNG